MICPYTDEDKTGQEKCCFNVISHCTDENMLNYKIDGQTVLLSVTQATLIRGTEEPKLTMNLIADAVHPISVADLAAHTRAWIETVDMAMCIPPNKGAPDEGTPRKCRRLTEQPSDSSVHKFDE